MKKRIQTDSFVLASAIIFTGFLLYRFPFLYPQNIIFENVADFLGMKFILKGIFLRMVARGHKKANSQKGRGLVITGPYTVVRNPMYFGSFLIGLGFVFILWPWWGWPIFVGIFYLRFSRQIRKEEEYLRALFGNEFENYCRGVPRLFPQIENLGKIKVKEAFPFQEAWVTKEKFGLLSWPVLAVLLDIIQQKIVFGWANVKQMVVIFLAAIIVFILELCYYYKRT